MLNQTNILADQDGAFSSLIIAPVAYALVGLGAYGAYRIYNRFIEGLSNHITNVCNALGLPGAITNLTNRTINEWRYLRQLNQYNRELADRTETEIEVGGFLPRDVANVTLTYSEMPRRPIRQTDHYELVPGRPNIMRWRP